MAFTVRASKLRWLPPPKIPPPPPKEALPLLSIEEKVKGEVGVVAGVVGQEAPEEEVVLVGLEGTDLLLLFDSAC